ncbi:pyrroloquinoline quinone biosynthesis protein PqqB [Kitasatospora sp. RB6PN24]|uniref:pyrroloquinoline quinone biosynthesis protein PqqB n=1 Tax=Kitasatospora humi TaxID=2893891 RepID=UPI001E4C9C0A|nr:pyrroloquinoline quinone biosynthesis protein PqqB [Kitasatospora humi]MCC9305972.1 pyrroloquinoline quinone biosynthesis protein PqqB [Kitasatospora humi]
MRVRVLGTAAGGGLPQWNCGCGPCARARAVGPGAWRGQETLAVSVSDDAWYLVNASPDTRGQLLAVPDLAPLAGTRRTPVRGVLLTDGELDHTVGLFALREGAELDIHAPQAVLTALTDAFPLRGLLAPYGTVRWQPTPDAGGELLLDDGRLAVSAVPISDKRPRYAAQSPAAGPWVVGYRLRETATGATLVYAPSLARWPAELDALLDGAHCALLDGTFWTEDEMAAVHPGSRTATAMGHLPISGPDGTLARLRPGPRVLYTHLNNTNPLSDPGSPARSALAAGRAEVAEDGQEIVI